MSNINIFSIIIFITLLAPPLLAQNTCEIQIDNNQYICKGQSVELCVNGADSYLWSTTEQSACIIVSPQETTIYQVLAAKNGCEAMEHITVNVNDKFLMPSSDDQTICPGQSIEICASNADSYYWSNGKESACITISPSQTEIFTVEGYKNGCKDTDHITVNVNESFELLTDGDQTICAGQPLEICATGADSYLWSNGKEKACIWVSPNHTKTFTVTGTKNGCEGNSEVTVNVNDSFNLQTDNDQTICAGQSIEICANGADSYHWSTGKKDDCITVSPHENTTYQVVAGKNGCEATGQVTVLIDPLHSNCSKDQLGLTDASGEWILEHENQTYTKFYVGNDEKMIIQNNGRVGIGTDTAMYKLDVCGTIRAVEVLVEDNWCDYVFEEDYQLPTLQEEKEHIKTNGYLLGFESEEAMAGKISLHDVTKRQQVKIEEYALQLIRLNENNKMLQKQNNDLEKKYATLEAMLIQLQNEMHKKTDP